MSKLDLRDSVDADTGALGFAQLQSRNDPYFAKIRLAGPPVLLSRNHCNSLGQCGSVRNARLTFGIEDDERGMRTSRQHGQETVGVLLLGEKWLGRRSSIYHLGPAGASGFDAQRISVPASVVDLAWTRITFEAPHLGDLSNPIILAWPEGMADSNPTGIRYRSLSSGNVDLALDEDQSWDNERSHSQESVVYWLIGKGNGLIRAQPISLETDHIF